MKTAQWFFRTSAFLLLASVAAVIACTRNEWSRVMPYLMWIHVAVIFLCISAFWKLRRMSSRNTPGSIPTIRAIFAPWLIAIGVAALLVAVPNWTETPFSGSHRSLSGASAGRVSWHASDGHYFERNYPEPEHEISKDEYETFERESYSVFARVWVLFSFVAVCLWHVVVLRLQPAAPGAAPGLTGETRQSASATPAAFEPAVSDPPSNGSTLAIVGIWLAVLASSLMQFIRPIEPTMCTAQFPFPVVVALMPFVVFGFSALRAKHSPFYSAWIAQIVDAKCGMKSYETFLIRLKPMLLFAAAAVAMAAALMVQCGKPLTDFFEAMAPTFFASAGAACAATHFLMRWRKLPGV
jgi:hypothetical protein